MENKDEKEILKEKEVSTKQETWWDFIKEMFRFTIISLIVVLPIRMFIAQPFLVSGGSMDPTFEDGQYLIIDEISYYFNKPERGQVVVFKYPNNPSKYFIKRIIGLPGETVVIKNNEVKIKNQRFPDGFLLEEAYVKKPDFQSRDIEVKLGEKQYFVMGDNRASSSDSRDWGPVEKKYITGNVLIRLLPITKINLYPGNKF